jgi:putative endopeptidase
MRTLPLPRVGALGCAAGVLLALGPALAAAAFADSVAEPPVPRFSIANMDPTVDPRVDFARYAAGNWYKTTEIPADKSSWGSFNQLDERNRYLIRTLLDAAAAQPGEAGSLEQKVGDFYATSMDTAAIEAAGLKPVAADLARISAIASVDDFIRAVAAVQGSFGMPLFRRTVTADDKQSDTYILSLAQGGLGLPTRDYYFDPRFEKERTAYLAHMARMFELAGDSIASAKARSTTAFGVEKSLAEVSKTPVQMRDPIANYHKLTPAELAAASPGFPAATYFDAIGLPLDKRPMVVRQPEFFAAIGRQLQSRPLDDWKTYLRWRVLADAAPFLTAAFENESFQFNGNVLGGAPEMEPRWQRTARVLDVQIGQAVGRLYVDRFFPAEVRARLAAMVANIQAAMKAHLERADWMSDGTRAKALAKFARFRAMIGYPLKWRDYSALTIRRDGYFDNIRRAGAFESRRLLGRIGTKVDRDEFTFLPPQVVNAYFQSSANQIVFLAAILQPPFFDPQRTAAMDYGASGATIGHEISHSFDNQGALFDADGRLDNWWTKEDFAHFEASSGQLVKQYDGYRPFPDMAVNGKQTLAENIADVAGLAAAYDAYRLSLQGKEAPVVQGLSGDQQFFLSFAQSWRQKMREPALRQRLLTDGHSPAQYRAETVRNLDPWYSAFDVGAGQALYLAPTERVKIW